MDLSLVIPSYNNIFNLRMVLKFVLLQQGINDYNIEIIVVDDCSQENVAKGIEDIVANKKSNMSIMVIRNEVNMGSAQTRNIGVAESVGDIIIFLDNDIILTPYALLSHIESHKNNDGDMIIGRIYDMSRKNFTWIVNELDKMTVLDEKLLGQNIEADMDPFFDLREEILNANEVSKKSIWVFGAFFCTSIKRGIFEKVRGIDNQFVGWGPEDIDFSYRIYKAGYNITYCNKVVCYHMDNNLKNREVFVRGISRNLKYLSNKYCNKEIENYLKFYKGSISYEEFDAFMNGKEFKVEDYSKLHKIGILKFIQFKTK